MKIALLPCRFCGGGEGKEWGRGSGKYISYMQHVLYGVWSCWGTERFTYTVGSEQSSVPVAKFAVQVVAVRFVHSKPAMVGEGHLVRTVTCVCDYLLTLGAGEGGGGGGEGGAPGMQLEVTSSVNAQLFQIGPRPLPPPPPPHTHTRTVEGSYLRSVVQFEFWQSRGLSGMVLFVVCFLKEE